MKKMIEEELRKYIPHTPRLKIPKPSGKTDEDGDLVVGQYLSNVPVLNFIAQSPIFNAVKNDERLVHRYRRNDCEFVAIGESLNFRCFTIYLGVMKLLNDLGGAEFFVTLRDLMLSCGASKSNISRSEYQGRFLEDLKRLEDVFFLVYMNHKGKKKLTYYFRLVAGIEITNEGVDFKFDHGLFKAFEDTFGAVDGHRERWTAYDPEIFGLVKTDYAKFLLKYYLSYTSDKRGSFNKWHVNIVHALGLYDLPIKDQNRYVKKSHEALVEAGVISCEVVDRAEKSGDLYKIKVLKRRAV